MMLTSFFSMCITASLMILAILLLRIILKRAPRWIFCLMWGMVALRLILPISFESRLSLLPAKDVISPSAVIGILADKDVIAQDVLSGIVSDEDIKNPASDNDNTVIGEGDRVTVPDGDIQHEEIHEGTEDITVPDGNIIFSPDIGGIGDVDLPDAPIMDGNNHSADSKSTVDIIITSLFAIWCVGMVALIGYFTVSMISLKTKLNTATLLYKNIKQSENIRSPFVLGVFNPTIYLPYKIDTFDMTYVLAHEKAHIHRGDHITKVIAFALLAVYWFNPLVWVAYIMFCRDIELACDEKVIKKFDTDGRRAYSYALLNCSVKHRSFVGCPVAFGETGVKRRVKGVMGYKKPTFSVIALALAACLLASLCFMTYPANEQSNINGMDVVEYAEQLAQVFSNNFSSTDTFSDIQILSAARYFFYEHGDDIENLVVVDAPGQITVPEENMNIIVQNLFGVERDLVESVYEMERFVKDHIKYTNKTKPYGDRYLKYDKVYKFSEDNEEWYCDYRALISDDHTVTINETETDISVRFVIERYTDEESINLGNFVIKQDVEYFFDKYVADGFLYYRLKEVKLHGVESDPISLDDVQILEEKGTFSVRGAPILLSTYSTNNVYSIFVDDVTGDGENDVIAKLYGGRTCVLDGYTMELYYPQINLSKSVALRDNDDELHVWTEDEVYSIPKDGMAVSADDNPYTDREKISVENGKIRFSSSLMINSAGRIGDFECFFVFENGGFVQKDFSFTPIV